MLKLNSIFNPIRFFRDLKRKDHKHVLGAFEIFKYIGPGRLQLDLLIPETGQLTLPAELTLVTSCFG